MLLILALVLTAFWVFTIVDCAVQPPTMVKTQNAVSTRAEMSSTRTTTPS